MLCSGASKPAHHAAAVSRPATTPVAAKQGTDFTELEEAKILRIRKTEDGLSGGFCRMQKRDEYTLTAANYANIFRVFLG
jgi:hypothetical protein